MVDLDIRVSVLYDCKVAESGYELVTKPATSKHTQPKKLLMPKIKATRYITKPFKWDAVAEFIELFPFHNSEEVDDAKRLLFCNKWGALKSEGEDNATLDFLRLKFRETYQAKEKGEYPEFLSLPQLSWKYSKDGSLNPAIECRDLYEAINVAYHINIRQRSNARMCLHFQTYGERKGCVQVFRPNRIDKMHCSDGCRDTYNAKQRKEKADAKKPKVKKTLLG